MKPRQLSLACALSALAILLVFVPAAGAAEIVGQVTNATTGQPVPGQSVNLLALRGRMVPVRQTQTDSDGRYRFVVAANPSERFLVQVPFQGVNYHQPALFTTGERITADVQVFESGARPRDISVQAQTIFLEPHRNHVRIQEFYSLQNHSRPPRTLAPNGGTFRFALPGTVGDLQVSAGRGRGMPLRQQPQRADQENLYVINYALQPGETEVQVSYVLPTSGNTFEVRLPLVVPAARRHLAVPRPGVQLEGPGLKELEQSPSPQVRLFEIEPGARKELSLRLTVDPEILETAAAAPAAPATQSVVSIVPNPVNRSQWYIVGLSLLVLSLGLYYLYSLRPATSGAHAPAPKPDHRKAR